MYVYIYIYIYIYKLIFIINCLWSVQEILRVPEILRTLLGTYFIYSNDSNYDGCFIGMNDSHSINVHPGMLKNVKSLNNKL